MHQRAVRKAKATYFNMIAKHHHTLKTLFSVINSVLYPPVNLISNPSVAPYEDFLLFFFFSVIKS